MLLLLQGTAVLVAHLLRCNLLVVQLLVVQPQP
jgi:hypothetical protein